MDVKHLQSFVNFADDKLKKHNLFQTPRFFLDVYCLKPGQAQKPHAHSDADKVYVVLEGSARVNVGAQTQVLKEGAAVLAPAGVEHGVDNPGPENARLLVMMTPPPAKS
ncbi:MAG: cupin domain-containing protein [Myxococcaceae bacterium]